jgi:hypothetical protein
VCDLEISTKRQTKPEFTCCATEKKVIKQMTLDVTLPQH